VGIEGTGIEGSAIAVMVGAIVLTATAGDVLLASAMRKVGDLDRIKEARGLPGAIWAVVSEGRFVGGGDSGQTKLPHVRKTGVSGVTSSVLNLP
jgi:hypothetical protein